MPIESFMVLWYILNYKSRSGKLIKNHQSFDVTRDCPEPAEGQKYAKYNLDNFRNSYLFNFNLH